MTRVVRKARDTIPEDERITNAQGVVVGKPPTGDADAVIVRQLDGTEILVPANQMGLRYSAELTPVDPRMDMDAVTAMEIGLGRILLGMKCHQHDLEARLARPDDLQSKDFTLDRVLFDFPRQEDELAPLPSALIQAPEDHVYDRQDLQTILLEDSLDVFKPRTVLRKLAHVTTTLLVTIWSDHKESRRGLKAALERTLLAEPGDDRQGRRVVVREHFDRLARFTMKRTRYPDDPGSAQANQWVLQTWIDADIDRVVLVKAPPRMEPRPSFDLGIGEDVEPDASC